MIPLSIETIPGGYRFCLAGKEEWGSGEIFMSLTPHDDSPEESVCVHITTTTFGEFCIRHCEDTLEAMAFVEDHMRRLRRAAQESTINDIVSGSFAVLLARSR